MEEIMGNEEKGPEERKYFLVFDAEKGDFEKVFFKENQKGAQAHSSSVESSQNDSDSDKSSRNISIIRRPGCVTI